MADVLGAQCHGLWLFFLIILEEEFAAKRLVEF
jgi:hypothetical protein